MATIDEIRAQGVTIFVPRREILEPLTAPTSLREKLGRFEENYDLSTSSHLYRLLAALCGGAGAGSLKRELLYPTLQSALESTYFNDLDRLYGNPLALPRLSEEVYAIDPRNEVMTQTEWRLIQSRDASYRARCLVWMRALLEGPTKRGIAYAAEAACGYECDVFEQYEYLDNLASDTPAPSTNLGKTASRQEFIIVPRAPSITEADRRRIMRLVDKLRPVNSISSVYPLSPARGIRSITSVESTSDRFYVSRLVTGRPDISWPSLDLSQAYWIESSIEKEAPTFAFVNAQETSTFLTITDTSASSEHVGVFDADQRLWFGNLQNQDSLHVFDSTFAFANAFAPIQVMQPWVRGYGNTNTVTLINNFYPLGYFAESNISQLPIDDPTQFWASEEQFAPSSEWLIVDFGSVRPINFLDFEVSQKPIDFKFEYKDTGTGLWKQFTYDTDYQARSSVSYIPSLDNPWAFVENHFDRVTTQMVRITFTRRDENFPFESSDPIRWSVDVRNLHAAHTIVTADDFIVDSGVDILGNSYRTDITILTPGLSGGSMTEWQSQPNPVPDAVEALYFDLRTGSQVGTMTYLDTADFVGDYDTRGMADMELYHPNGVIIDEIFIDPITFGPSMHFYYSNDDTPEWDNKLWTPINRHYILKRGFHAFPSSVKCRYIKIEFTNLVPAPYQSPEYPAPSELIYRKYPSWVQSHFSNVVIDQSLVPNSFDRVTVDPLELGFRKLPDYLDSNYGSLRIVNKIQSEDEVKSFIQTITHQTPTDIQTDMESRINFYSSFMYQQDLISQLDDTRALSRYVLTNESSINAELPPFIEPTPDTQSVPDLSSELEFKTRPTMFFPRRSRHQYQILRGTNTQKLAFFVGIRTIGFYRRDFTVSYDEPVYFQALDDAAHTSTNEFIADDFGYVVIP